MLHKIYRMYSDIKNKQERNYAMLLTSISKHEESNKVNKTLEDSRDNDDKNQPILKKMFTLSDINDVQPRATQVWNYNKIGFDPNVIWSKVICNYKLFQGEKCGKCKLENEHNSVACYLYLP